MRLENSYYNRINRWKNLPNRVMKTCLIMICRMKQHFTRMNSNYYVQTVHIFMWAWYLWCLARREESAYSRYGAIRHYVPAAETELDKLGSVKTLQSIGSPNPDKTFFILVNAADHITQQPWSIFGGKPGEGKSLLGFYRYGMKHTDYETGKSHCSGQI